MLHKKAIITVVAITTLSIMAVCALSGCGRTASRYAGKGQRQVLKVEKMKEFISMSFHPSGGSTVKDVTYLADDGYVYTREFKDMSPLEGTIRWVPHNESESLLQSRTISRWTGSDISLRLPEDCKQVKGVDVANVSAGERVKNVTYLSTDGHIYCKEYREGMLNRHLSGWIEVARQD